MEPISEQDKRTVELSQLLQSTAIHGGQRPPNFRNPASIRRKSHDIATQHPDSDRKPTNGNHLDIEVLQDFRRDAAAMRAKAEAIREVLTHWEDQRPNKEIDLDIEGEEGGVLLRRHLRRERDPRLKATKIADARSRGVPLACEACGFDFHRAYGPRGLDYIECHHRTPLSATGKTKTQIRDLALICSNCHRMIHRTKAWLTVEALGDLVDSQRATIDGNELPRQASPYTPPDGERRRGTVIGRGTTREAGQARIPWSPGVNCGGRGIRTHVGCNPKAVFKTAAIGH